MPGSARKVFRFKALTPQPSSRSAELFANLAGELVVKDKV
jgi:hypothetical protein